jgi:hypothetical protein
MMPNANFRASQWVMLSLALVALGAFAITTDGQYAPSVFVGGVQINGVPDDWTHHHMIFNPGTEQEAIQSGHYEQWQKIVNEPRYVIQQLKKNLPVQGPAAADAAYREQWISEDAGVPAPQNLEPRFGFVPRYGRPTRPIAKPVSNIQKDWSMTSGGTGGLAAGHYPAKYQFGATSAESCADYVVFPTGITGSATQATLIAYNNIYKSPTCTGTVPSILLSINTGGVAKTSPVLSLDGTQVAFIQTTPTPAAVTGSVTRGSTTFTVTAATLTCSEVGAGISGTDIPAGDTIAAITNCPGTPGASGTLTTAATGTNRNPETLTIAGSTQLVLLRIGAGGGTAVGSPLSPAAVTNANYRACTGPCYTTLTLDNDPTDTNSAPFYVYSSSSGSPDILYVGDDTGNVHKFTNVFLTGTPAEVTTNWPVTASTEATPGLDSPIYDSVSGDIFVGDASGYLHQFAPPSTTAATVYTSGHLAYNTGGLVDPPVVDDTSGTDLVYQFVGYSDYTDKPSYINVFETTGTLSIVGGTSFGTGVYFPNGTEYTRPASANTAMHAGTFDNVYFSGTGETGNIYACSDGILYQVPVAPIVAAITAKAAEEGTVNIYNIPTSAADLCSPVTEFYNTSSSTDYLFMSVSADGIASGGSTCTVACVLNYIAPTSPTAISGTPTAGLAATGGTSGIIIDNAGAGGGSEIYFTSVGSETCSGANGTGPPGNGTGSCAVQATQAGLQ